MVEPDWGATQPGKLRATWIGHASWLVEAPAAKDSQRGLRILFDPVFSERTSPFGFVGPKRYTPTPCTINNLPDVDIICISHNHYDHLDIHTVTPLYQRLKGRVHIFAGLGTKQWFLDNVGCAEEDVTELDWWEARKISVPSVGTVDLTCCPTQHSSGRSLTDAGKALWCSWAMKTSEDNKLFFAGDTAYQALDTPSPCPAFAHIGKQLGPFDLALLPIGLYSPPAIAASLHVHPEQTLKLHKDIRSKLSIGMHYGTVRGGLSQAFEDVRDPPRRWREAAEKEDMWCGGGVEGRGKNVDVSREGVGLCHVGETVAI